MEKTESRQLFFLNRTQGQNKVVRSTQAYNKYAVRNGVTLLNMMRKMEKHHSWVCLILTQCNEAYFRLTNRMLPCS